MASIAAIEVALRRRAVHDQDIVAIQFDVEIFYVSPVLLTHGGAIDKPSCRHEPGP